jgi:hypothetical protein
MFDEQNKNLEIPANLPTEPVDMFMGVDKNEGNVSGSIPDALSAGLLKKKDDASGESGMSSMADDSGLPSMSGPTSGKIILVLVAILLLGALAYGGWWFFYGNKKEKVIESSNTPKEEVDKQANQQSQTSTVVVVTSTSGNIPAQINNDQILFGQTVDRDKDGLDDLREKEIGTNPLKMDTDGDGLNDGDEAITYKTDPLLSDTDSDELNDGVEILIWHSSPLNRDTDGDTYLDGEEVKNGYNPVGPGKLFSSTSTPVSGSTTSLNKK